MRLEEQEVEVSTVWIAAALLLVLVGLFTGCAGWKAPTYGTLTFLVDSATAARAALPSACELAQQVAVDRAKPAAAARPEVAKVQARCDATLAGIEAAVAEAKIARDEIAKLPPGGVTAASIFSWAAAAIDGYHKLVPLLAGFGIALPALPGGL